MPVQAQRPPEAKFSKEQEVLGRLPSPEWQNPTSDAQLWGLLLQPVSGSQEEWSDETWHQSETAQSVGGDTALQDGGYLNLSRPPEGWGMDGKGGSERCLLHPPNSPSQFTLNINSI